MRASIILAGLAFPALGAENTTTSGDIPPDEWRELALGRTLTYMIGDEFFALERYAPTGNRVELQLNNGECLAGTWSHSDNVYCFDWGSGRNACFRHVRAGSEIVIIQMDGEVETSKIQHMTQISDAPLSCGENMS